MLTLEQAAERLGYTSRGLWEIVDRSRIKLRGVRVDGPTIKFFQGKTRGKIMFRPQWLDDFITANTNDPDTAVPSTPVRAKPAVIQTMPRIKRPAYRQHASQSGSL